MANRKYNFDLPLTISSFKVNFVPGILKDEGVWDNIPKNLQDKLLNHGWNDVVVTKADLDELDNTTWAKIRNKFATLA